MRRLTLALLLAPTLALAQPAPQPTPAEIAQAGAATSADLASLVVQLRAQLLAESRDRAACHVAAEKKPEPEKPAP